MITGRPWITHLSGACRKHAKRPSSTMTPEYTDEEILAAAHRTMTQSGRSWIRASDIYLELLRASRSSETYHQRQKMLPGSRIYYVLRTHGFRRDTSGSTVRRNPKYNYTGGEQNGNPGDV